MNSNNKGNSIVQLIDPVTDPRWDEFVASHPFGWICHLSGWKTVLEKSFKHMKGYYYVLLNDKGEKIQAGLPVYLVNSWLTGKRIVSIPFATLCDPLIAANDEMGILMKSVIDLAKCKKALYIEIRTFKSGPLVDDERFGSNDFFKHHYLTLDQEPEKLMKKFHRTCVKQRISRAIKNELKIKKGESCTDLETYYLLHSLTRKRLGLPVHPYKLFRSLWDTFKESGFIEILIAKKNTEAIAGIILFKYKDRVSAEFACSNDEYFNISPNHFVFWEAIKLAYEEGYKIFDFGRTSATNKSLMDFKRHWGTDVIDMNNLYSPKEMALKMCANEMSWKYKTMKEICRKSPDMLQQLIGKFVYNHLG